ncbi:PucR family transcriptional regulator [Brevibacterium permense]|uniref:PucR C-terminal helix-turn-helix domain-containing protein n=1 Tax=Brevibacterium permense TaxID=234834 RepID=A0ABP4L8A0_9MICO|nr:helix-turn-helix domain-containing protein [Brevibacterium permense]
MGGIVEQIEQDFKKPEYRYMQPTLDYLARMLACSLYIEDSEGRLLFAQSDPVGDDWRTDFTPLSLPAIRHYERATRIWTRSAETYIPVPGDQSFQFRRTVIPLTYHSEVFSFIHIVSPAPSQHWPVGDPEIGELVTAVANKLFILVLGTINEYRAEIYHQHARIDVRRAARDHPRTLTGAADVLTACAFVPLCSSINTNARTIDYRSMATMAGMTLADRLTEEHGPVTGVTCRSESDSARLDLIMYFTTVGSLRLAEIAKQLRDALSALHWNLKIGLSMIPDGQAGIERGEQEARAMINLSSDASRAPQVLTRDDGGVSALALVRGGGAGFLGYAEFIKSALADAEPELLDTARSFARHECNVSNTAIALEVDRRTVTYRLHRIARLTGLDLPSFPAKIVLYLAFLPESPET